MQDPSSGGPAHVLVRVPNWLGDAVMALPALQAVRRHFAAAALSLAAVPSVAPLFREAVDLGRVDVVPLEGTRSAQVRALGAANADLAILMTNSFGSAWVARRARIPERWGYRGAGRRWLLTRTVVKPRGRVHQVGYYQALVAGLGVEPHVRVPVLSVTEATGRRADALLAERGWDPAHPLVGFAPGAAYGHAKRWPPARVAEVIARLAAERDVTAVLVGAPADREAGREIESSIAGRVPGQRLLNLIGQTELPAAMGVIARCRAFVTNDSGAMHLAAALSVPVTAVFGPTDERVTAPVGDHVVLTSETFCRPCMLHECPIDHRCMKRIAPDQVLDAVLRQLDRQKGRA